MDEVPIIIGSAGLLGRPQVRPVFDDYTAVDAWAPQPSEAIAIPSGCKRLLSVPYRNDGGHECDTYCQGRQKDGGCLCPIIRDANTRGVSFDFEIDPEGYWILVEK